MSGTAAIGVLFAVVCASSAASGVGKIGRGVRGAVVPVAVVWLAAFVLFTWLRPTP